MPLTLMLEGSSVLQCIDMKTKFTILCRLTAKFMILVTFVLGMRKVYKEEEDASSMQYWVRNLSDMWSYKYIEISVVS